MKERAESPTSGVAVTQRSVQTHVGQLAASHVLLLGGHVREDDLARLQSHLLGSHVDVGLSHLTGNS